VTRPEQPVEYGARPSAQPADYGTTQPAAAKQTIRREYRDALGRVLVGYAIIRNERDFSFRVEIPNGVLNLDLAPGSYRIMTTLAALGEVPHNQAETVTVAKYR